MKKELFSGKLCHILLYRELHYPGAQPDEMWLGVENRAVRFGKDEFLLVTGLRFGLIPQSVNSLPKVVPDSVYHRYFRGSPTPLKDILGRLSGEEFDESEDVMKLGYMYLLFHILLGREYRWFVPDWLWGLVEDITEFEAFPWGTYIYIVTLYWLGKVLPDRRNGRKKNRNYSTQQDLGYNVYGFPWALMYWAMEAIPVLTGLVGKRKRGRTGLGFPQLTRWYCWKKPAHLGNKFNNELEALTNLSPTQEEKRQEYYRQFDPLAVVGSELHKDVGYDLEKEPSRCGRRGRAPQASIDTESRLKMNHDPFSCRQSFNKLRSYIDSRFEQMDLKINKLCSDFLRHSYAYKSKLALILHSL
ncbi:hypothetical protein Ddye_021431 [Dipteronia dyeriana]|uniref:DUF1985 domain-containing protein n=1 Tax=Dipteronia dyeriana TaxID=168575 RepID=A0AAD9U2E9_9ROSI|nr:hypothetical protein Ddye_021431 [Dipteronia dyeriana]